MSEFEEIWNTQSPSASLSQSPASEAGSGPVERDEMKVSAVRERADSLGGGRAAEQPRMADANVEVQYAVFVSVVAMCM